MAAGIYVPLDVNYLRDPKVRRAGPEAELLYLRSLAHAKGGSTDGFIADFDLDVVAVGLPRTRQRVKALIDNALWAEVDGGWQIAGWTKWNKTNRQLADDKEAKRRGAEKTNHARYHVGPDADFNPSCSLCRTALSNGGVIA